jgi:hypothetical protein
VAQYLIKERNGVLDIPCFHHDSGLTEHSINVHIGFRKHQSTNYCCDQDNHDNEDFSANAEPEMFR